jgi:DNA-binding XRE family transcriptional regulator
MATNTKRKRKPSRTSARRATAVRGLHGVRVICPEGRPKLELRDRLHLTREHFGRLVNVSVRTIAKVESENAKAEGLQRDYLEVTRLCDALAEVVDESGLGEWFYTPNKAFDGSKPIEIIERGEIDRLWEMVYRLRSGMPG